MEGGACGSHDGLHRVEGRAGCASRAAIRSAVDGTSPRPKVSFMAYRWTHSCGQKRMVAVSGEIPGHHTRSAEANRLDDGIAALLSKQLFKLPWISRNRYACPSCRESSATTAPSSIQPLAPYSALFFLIWSSNSCLDQLEDLADSPGSPDSPYFSSSWMAVAFDLVSRQEQASASR